MIEEKKHLKALVTGSSKGIGAAVTEGLLVQDYTVTGIARTHPDNLLQQEGFIAETIDLADLDVLPQRFRQLKKSIGTVDVIVCNAGYGQFGALEEFSAAQIRQLIDVNLTSHLLLLREFVPVMKRQRHGHIIFIGSESALQGARKGTVYAASKFALRGLAQSLRDECSAAGLQVTIINPGMVNSGFFDELSFRPNAAEDCHLEAGDVATAVLNTLQYRNGVNIDEINLTPRKKVIDFDKKS